MFTNCYILYVACWQGIVCVRDERKSKDHGQDIWYKVSVVGAADESGDDCPVLGARRKTWFNELFGVQEILSEVEGKKVC